MVKVAVISYLNTLPFIYGLQNHPVSKQMELINCVPSEGARLLAKGDADLGIIPVAAIPFIENAKIVSNFCIGATARVDSVLLCSNVPLEEIKELYLDRDSLTSVTLARVLCKEYWKIAPEFIEYTFNSITLNINRSYILIGDKALVEQDKFEYVYDLAQEWIDYRNKPFVFACWVANRELPDLFIKEFNAALEYGVSHIEAALTNSSVAFSKELAISYLKNNISYNLDSSKRESLQDLWSLALEELKSKVRW